MKKYKATISEFRKSGSYLMPPIVHIVGGKDGVAKTELLKGVRDKLAEAIKVEGFSSINVSITEEK